MSLYTLYNLLLTKLLNVFHLICHKKYFSHAVPHEADRALARPTAYSLDILHRDHGPTVHMVQKTSVILLLLEDSSGDM